jgi:uncharacterized membrane protein YvbJ
MRGCINCGQETEDVLCEDCADEFDDADEEDTMKNYHNEEFN